MTVPAKLCPRRMTPLSERSTMKRTMDFVQSAWETFRAADLPCPAIVGAKALCPLLARCGTVGSHAAPSCQEPCTKTYVPKNDSPVWLVESGQQTPANRN